MRDAIAIDFDGCLCVNAYPGIGAPNRAVIAKAKERQAAGAGLILWTCREGPLLQNAVDACKGWDLTFDAINESLPDWIEAFGTRPRKVGATEYWDDRAVVLPVSNEPLTLAELRTMAGEPVFVIPLGAYARPDEAEWCIFSRLNNEDRYSGADPGGTDCYSYDFLKYYKTWIAFRHKPENVAELQAFWTQRITQIKTTR